MGLISDGLSFFGAMKANDAAEDQLKFQKEQFKYQKYLSEEQLKLAKEAQRLGKATQIDGRGNVLYFDDATNTWKSVLSLTSQALQSTSDREQLLQLGEDSALARGERLINARRRTDESATADADLAAINRIQQQGGAADAGSLAAQMRLNREGIVNRSFDDVASNIATQALRSGATGQAGASGRLAAARARAMAEIQGNPEIEALQLAQGLNTTQTNNLVNRYNLMASRASNIGDAPFNPSGVGETGAALTAARQLAAGGVNSSAGITANAGAGMRQAANQIDYTMGGQAGGLWAGAGDLLAKWESQIANILMPGAGGTAPKPAAYKASVY